MVTTALALGEPLEDGDLAAGLRAPAHAPRLEPPAVLRDEHVLDVAGVDDAPRAARPTPRPWRARS